MREDNLDVSEELNAAVIRAISRKPEVVVPEDFARELVKALPRKAPSHLFGWLFATRPVYARSAGYLAAASTTVLLAVITRSHPDSVNAGRGVPFALEMLLVAQLLGIGLWLGTRTVDV